MTEIRRILVAIDFSEPSRRAFDAAAELAQAFGAELDVLHVWEAPLFIPPEVAVVAGHAGTSLVETVRAAAEKALDDFVADANRRGIAVHSARAEMGLPVFAIADAAADYDLLVLGTHGRGGLPRFVLGSVAERVVRHSPCPVLTVRQRLVSLPRDEGHANQARHEATAQALHEATSARLPVLR